MRARTWRRVGGVALIAIVLSALTPAAVVLAAPPAFKADKAAHDSWIVTLQPGVKANGKAADLSRGAGGRVGHVYKHALHGFVFKGSAMGAAALARNPNVQSVTLDGTMKLAADGIPTGIGRIAANSPTRPDAHEAGFTGAGARIAIIDTGIDLDHPDLAASLDLGLGLNCMTDPPGSAPPEDGHGHGTHVAGIAAAPINGTGVVGVAPDARIVPIKVLDDAGVGEWSNLICAIDYLTGLATDGDPANDVQVANMSLGDVGDIGTCNDGFVREALCTSVAAGITYIAAAGNSTVDTSTFIPAAMPEVIAVSSINDLDGLPGGAGGCLIPFINLYCDDALSEFSNFGSAVDVAAPGFQIVSDWVGGGTQANSGTSMASPHVAGVAALVRAVNPALGPADVAELIEASGECANGAFADDDGTGTCIGKGTWRNDPDGYGEPVVNALNAATAADAAQAKPTISITSPANGDNVSGVVTVTADASSSVGLASVAFDVNGATASTDTDGTDGWAFDWATAGLEGGTYSIRATATDTAGASRSAHVAVHVGTNVQGDWSGVYGANGYVIGGWNAPTGDLVGLPTGVTYTLEQGARYNWTQFAGNIRALESPNQSERKASGWYHATQTRLRLNFTNAYSGTLHLYTVDHWLQPGRRANVTVDDGAGPRTIALSSDFSNGAWMHFPISVAAGGSVTIKVDLVAGGNTILSGLFLGGAWTPPVAPPQPTVEQPGVQGDWSGVYGANGYVIGGWNAPTGDLVGLPTGVTYTLEQGARYNWTQFAGNIRALESPNQSERKASGWYHATQTRLRLNFTNAYSGTLHLYTVDHWLQPGRRANVTVDDGAGPRTIALSSDFSNGAWMHFPISVAAGGSVTIKVDLVAGGNTILSGLFLGGAWTPPVAPPQPTVEQPGVQGDWSGVYGANGYVIGGWNAPTGDLVGLPTGVTYTLEQGARYNWTQFAGNIRALESPNQSERKASGWYHATQTRLRLNFTNAYSGTLHLYTVDHWLQPGRRANVTVDDGAGPRTIALSSDFSNGAWMHFPISVAAGGSVTIKVDLVAGGNTILSGLFLGGAWTPPVAPPQPTVEQPGVQGDWSGVYGANGYVIGGWNAPTGDLVGLPTGVTYTLEQGARYNWTQFAGNIRALESPNQSERKASGWYHATQTRLRLNFTNAYSGTLHLYTVDHWLQPGRRANVTVDDGAGPRTIALSSDFSNGAWMHFPISVAAGGSVTIKVDLVAGGNTILSGLFLGGATQATFNLQPSPTPTPQASPTPTPQPSPTPTPQASPTPSPQPSPTPTPQASPTPTPTPQPSPASPVDASPGAPAVTEAPG